MADAAEPADKLAEAREDQAFATVHDSQALKLPLARRIQIPVISNAAYALTRIIGPTLRYEVLGWQHIDWVHATGRRCVYSFWHRTIFLAMWWWRHQGVVAMTSGNFDGQLLGRALERLGFGTTHGSSSRGGLRGLAALSRQLRRGHDAAFAADGPRGPRYAAKAGPILLARRTGCPIVGFHLFAERAHTFEKSWDRFQLPYLFSRVVLVVGAPIEVPREADRETIDRKHAELQALLERARDTAEAWFTLSRAERERERALWNKKTS
jgi:lysophospholipid acyltransferase (LPLAT)-like uncharacterized protein